MNAQNMDVIIAGGGLAGLSLARQLKMANAKLSITIIEKRKFPVPETIGKVGESTVEIGSHYFSEKLKLKSHFDDKHLKKNGLRCFFGEPQDDYARQDELGVSELFGISTYQIERGVLENYLYQDLISQGVNIVDDVTTTDIHLGNKEHSILVDANGVEQTYTGAWFVDAAGRQHLLKNKLALDKPNAHQGNAVWFRVDKRIVIDEWTNDEAWQARTKCSHTRWLSTNHLMGPGYWIWIIPLGSGATSFGIVIDDQALEESGISNYEDTLQWLQKNHPHCAKALIESDAKPIDFVVLKDYSSSCKQMFSDQGWCLTGESGAFTDPFYSPGSDFIAINNTFITHLICNDKQEKDIRLDAIVFHKFYDSFFESTLSLYSHQYGGFGDRQMMGVKLVWDYSYYWGVLSLLFFRDTMTDIHLMRKINPLLTRAQIANKAMQEQFVERAKLRLVLPVKGVFLNQYMIPCLVRFNDILKAGDSIDVEQAIGENVIVLEELLVHLSDMLHSDADTTITDKERALLGEYRSKILA
jgi:flavin-dependent dehydrogenase